MQLRSGNAGNADAVLMLEVLDRVLDKGLVIDAWARFSLVGLDLVTVQACIVVTSIETYLDHAEALRMTLSAASPRQGAAAGEPSDERSGIALGSPASGTAIRTEETVVTYDLK